MKFWNDEMRICPSCKVEVELKDEPKARCPQCRKVVWFFDYLLVPSPPEVPEPKSEKLWENPTTTLLLSAAAILALTALVSVHQRVVVSAVCAIAAFGFAAFGFIRHWEARQIESSLDHMSRIRNHGVLMTKRIKEMTARYNYLLDTGDQRVQHYFDEVYRKAEEQRNEAVEARRQAHLERQAIRTVEDRIFAMAERFIGDHRDWVSQRMRADPEDYQRKKNQLIKACDFVVSIGYSLPEEVRKAAFEKLKNDYKKKVRDQALKDEQRRLNRQAREEERLFREREKALKEAESKEQELQRLLDEAMREHRDSHSAEVDELRRQLEQAHADAERAKSMAQLTKVGHVYILSNIGSFGENVYKVGMTRRLEPEDRVKELGDASVPFPFDVHAMIGCENAPKLENALHHALTRYRVNRVNLRKEYFAVDLDTILGAVSEHHGRIEYVAEPEALQYRESLTITPEQLIDNENELIELGVVFEEVDE